MSCGGRFLKGEKNLSPSFILCSGKSVQNIMLSIEHYNNYCPCMPICYAPLNETIGKTHVCHLIPKKSIDI